MHALITAFLFVLAFVVPLASAHSDVLTPRGKDSLVTPTDQTQASETLEGREVFATGICTQIEARAAENALPAAFLARLIWQESRFDPFAVSPAGAQGIAQFMPGTAQDRDLNDPFDPPSALRASAMYLADLRQTFGNLGLAAAAYNAGEQRVREWLSGVATLPVETQRYVLIITGRPPDEWVTADVSYPIPAVGEKGNFFEQCHRLVQHNQRPGSLADAGRRGYPDAGDQTGLHFSHFPSELQMGISRAPQFEDRDKGYRAFKSKIIKALNRGPNFAGHFTVLAVPCGSDCSRILVADRLTGRVRELAVPPGIVSYSSDPQSHLLLISNWIDTSSQCEVKVYLWEKFSARLRTSAYHQDAGICRRGTKPEELSTFKPIAKSILDRSREK